MTSVSPTRSKFRENIQLPIEPCPIYYDAEQSSFEEVASTVPNKDDPTMACLTLRSFLLGLFFVLTMSIVHQYTDTTSHTIYIQPALVILFTHLFSRLISLFNWKRLTIKEETLVLIMANVAWSFYSQYRFAIKDLGLVLGQQKNKRGQVFYIILALQFLGFALAGILRRALVWPSGQLWPKNLPFIALLRTLNEQQNFIQTGKQSLWKRMINNYRYFFFILLILQFVFSWAPNYMMLVLSSFSTFCLFLPKSYITAQVTGFYGLGFGSLSFDWYSLTDILGSPVIVPRWAFLNIIVGFFIVTYIITPIVYFQNVWDCREQPIAYYPYSALSISYNDPYCWSALGITTTATAFASLPAVIVHLCLFHGKELWTNLRTKSLKHKGNDLHCRLISIYPDTPIWWFLIISLIALAMVITICEISDLLRGYFVLLALLVPWTLVLPMGYIFSHTGQVVQNKAVYYSSLILANLIVPNSSKAKDGRILFRTIIYVTFGQAIYIVSNMKLAHYMKIPSRVLFLVQSVACLVSTVTSMLVSILSVEKFRCTNPAVVCAENGKILTLYDFTEIGVYEYSNFFQMQTRHRQFLWMFLVGFLLPIPPWLASFRWRKCRFIHIPLMLVMVTWMPLVSTGSFFTWSLIGLISCFLFHKHYLTRHVYLFSIAMDIGVGLMFIFANTILYSRGVSFVSWWGTGGVNRDGCPLTFNTTMTRPLSLLS